MSEIQIGSRRYSGPAFFSFAFRPFFFCGALFAGLAIPVWATLFTGHLVIDGDPMRWHAHEMLFGYLGAVIGGFLLTAIPNWTGRLPVAGAPLAEHLALWLLGRIGAVLQALVLIAPAFGIVLELLYWVALSGAAFREIIAGNNKRNLPVVTMIPAFALADIVTFLPDWTTADPMLGARLAIALAATLISLIGGRITPSFTRNWLSKAGRTDFPVPYNTFDLAAILMTIPAFAFWIVLPEGRLTAGAAILAAAMHAIRLWRWRGWTTWREPLVLVLHLAYTLVPIGFAAVAASAAGWLDDVAAIHVVTVGTVASMMLAVMTRATRGHTGRELTASAVTCVSYVSVLACACVRPLAAAFPEQTGLIYPAAGALWIIAFALYLVEYGPMLVARRKPSARSA